MTIQSIRKITTEKANELLKAGLPLINSYVDGELTFEVDGNWDKEVVLQNCIIEKFTGHFQAFEKPVKLTNCYFKNCDFMSASFLGGLTIDNCTFETCLDFSAGGHNKAGNPVIITNNNFKDFVDFFDCWYENEVIISGNKFQQGTNLLGRVHGIPVSFDIEPIIENNTGEIDVNIELKNE